MMWWGADGYWAQGWGWPGVVVMALFMIMCVAMMSRMMGHGMHRDRPRRPEGDRREAPERTLAERLARGEIDVDEYDRLLEVLQRPTDSTRA